MKDKINAIAYLDSIKKMGPSFCWPHADAQLRALIEASGEKDKLRGSSNVGIGSQSADGPGSSPGPRSPALPAEVEEAMEILRKAVTGYSRGGQTLEDCENSLAVIRAALTATIKPTLTVAPTIQVTREWLTGAIGTIAFRAFTCENHRALVDCIEQDMARLEEMLRELGIEVEP